MSKRSSAYSGVRLPLVKRFGVLRVLPERRVAEDHPEENHAQAPDIELQTAQTFSRSKRLDDEQAFAPSPNLPARIFHLACRPAVCSAPLRALAWTPSGTDECA